MLLTIWKLGLEINLAFADTFWYLAVASGKPVMQITGFVVYVMVAIVQLVRTPGCGPGGRGFKSHWSPITMKNGIPSFFIFLFIDCPYRLEA
jgi:hypothetical protein